METAEPPEVAMDVDSVPNQQQEAGEGTRDNDDGGGGGETTLGHDEATASQPMTQSSDEPQPVNEASSSNATNNLNPDVAPETTRANSLGDVLNELETATANFRAAVMDPLEHYENYFNEWLREGDPPGVENGPRSTVSAILSSFRPVRNRNMSVEPPVENDGENHEEEEEDAEEDDEAETEGEQDEEEDGEEEHVSMIPPGLSLSIDGSEDEEHEEVRQNGHFADGLMLDISEASSSSSTNENPEDVARDNGMRHAFREMLLQNRRGTSYRDNFLQRLRSAFFAMEHRAHLRRAGRNDSSADAEPEPEPEADALPENPIWFDTNLPAEHSYLGSNMDRVSGVNYFEVGQHYTIMLFMHQHILFPGEVLPFMISDTIIESDVDSPNGMVFGVCFPVLCDKANEEKLYGVTCQIYEKGTYVAGTRDNTFIKSRALQRFEVNRDQITGPLQFIAAHPQLKCKGIIKILPEIFLPEPLKCVNMGSMNRFRDNTSMHEMYRRYQAVGTPWPPHVYNEYRISDVIEKARTQLAQHKIETMPSEPIQLSFWLVRNLHLSDDLMKEIFKTDSVNKRFKLISNTFSEDSLFTCRYCGNRIANCRQLFAMSKHGVQTQYCNSAGFIHQTNTVYQLLPDAITYSGTPSSEFSWFPGYEWHIIVCKICSRHIGWKFKGLEPNLVPKQFFGISSSSVRISSPTEQLENNPGSRALMLQNLMRMASEDIQ